MHLQIFFGTICRLPRLERDILSEDAGRKASFAWKPGEVSNVSYSGIMPFRQPGFGMRGNIGKASGPGL